MNDGVVVERLWWWGQSQGVSLLSSCLAQCRWSQSRHWWSCPSHWVDSFPTDSPAIPENGNQFDPWLSEPFVGYLTEQELGSTHGVGIEDGAEKVGARIRGVVATRGLPDHILRLVWIKGSVIGTKGVLVMVAKLFNINSAKETDSLETKVWIEFDKFLSGCTCLARHSLPCLSSVCLITDSCVYV